MRFLSAVLVLSISLCLSGCKHDQYEVVATDANPVTKPDVQAEAFGIIGPAGSGATGPVTSDDDAIINSVIANGDSKDVSPSLTNDRAVVFGDNFVGTPAELHECVNDARKNVLNLIRFEKFDPKNIRLFLNDQCTKANYEKWTLWMLEGAKPGDRRALFNSSHGAEDTDAAGNTVDVIVTWDMIAKNQWDETTEVSASFWSTNLRSTACNFLILNDCCHAGGDMRLALGAISNGKGKRVRSVEGPAPVKARVNTAIRKVGVRTQLQAIPGTVIPACQDSELSEESSGFGGAATESYWRARKTLPIEAKSGDIIREANRVLRENQFSQHMGLVGQNKPLWSAN